jgi:hypothetical protein
MLVVVTKNKTVKTINYSKKYSIGSVFCKAVNPEFTGTICCGLKTRK